MGNSLGMRGHGRRSAARRRGAFVLSLAILMSVTGCSSALDDVIRSISRSQNVDEATVRTALKQSASTEDEQLKLARQWEADLPGQDIPNLSSAWDDLSTNVRTQVKSATCSALIDIAREGEVPSGEQFVTQYLSDIATGSLPYGELQQLVSTFDELWADAYAGTLTYYDIRLTMMEIQYC